jgi:D-tyrosyl-tRNA(Tyr) deacylase
LLPRLAYFSDTITAPEAALPALLAARVRKSLFGEVVMRAVLQRVRRGKVSVDGRSVAEIGPGLVILLGVGHADSEEAARALAEKTANLRIFEDDQGKMNLSIREIHGSAIVVSQFTLYADTRKGRRPSFVDAAFPDSARPLVDRFASLLAEQGVPTQQGEFGEHMLVEIENDGPVTILLEM